jgi:hypothetical protein
MTESRLVQCPTCGATNRVAMDEVKAAGIARRLQQAIA